MIEIVAQTGSTNADLAARLASGEAIPEGYWLIADRQTQGRGRQGRHWLDGPGNFMGSTLVRWQPARDPAPSSLGFVTSLAVYEVLVRHLPFPQMLQLKWPNDVMLGGAKLCGLLLERQGDSIVIGIGANLAEAPQITGRATAAIGNNGTAISRDSFAEALAAQMTVELQRWRDFGVEPILRRWTAVAHPAGTSLAVHGEKGAIITGAFHALDDDGALILRLPDGSTSVIHAGDVMLENG